MENIPLEIEQKLENLPIIPFDMSEDFQKILFSDNYNDIFNFYKTNYLPDVLKAKPEIYQRVSLYLTLTNQAENFTEQTDQVLYRRPVPSIDDFLTNKFFMGYSNATLYDFWKIQLNQIFKEGSPIRKVIFSGCIGCLTKDTTIATLNGDKTIEELLDNYDNEWVLSYNTTTNTWEPDKIIDVFYTGHRDVYEITLDNDEKIRCTDNHQFLTRKNKWVSIKDGTLVPGLSMMPYYYRESKRGYVEVKNNKNETWSKRYKIVANWKTRCAKYLAIHHKNYNKKDDRPSNLCVLKWKQHLDFHAKKGGEQWRNYAKRVSGEEFKQYRSDRSKKAYETYKNLPNFEELEKIRKRGIIRTCHDSEHQHKASYIVWHGKNSELNRKKASENFTKWNKGDIARKISRENAKYMRSLLSKKSTEEMYIINLKRKLPTIKRFHGVDSEEYLYILNEIHSKEPWYDPALGAKENHKRKKLYNHKIKSVIYVGKEDVYDITTERNHNFALKSGIIAHNSGKSTVARKAFVYVLYRILCLRYPRSVFNIDQDATIANVVISMSLKQVYETNILPFVKLMESMPCFQRVMSQRSFENFDLTNPNCPVPFVCEKSTGNIYFPDNIIITCGSNQGHFTGYNVVNSFCFTGDTKVYTNHGIITFMSLLRKFKNGYNFKTYCIDKNGIKQEVNILDVQETRKVTELIKIYYEDDKYITCTPDHPFVISNPSVDDPYIIYENGVAYKQAQYLTEEDEIASENQSYVYELIDNRPDSKNFNLPFYVGVSSHSNTISSIFNTQYSRAATHFTAKALQQDPNILKKSIIEDILSRNFTPDIKIIKTALTLNEAYTLEKQLIQQYGKRSNKTGILANLSDGGEGAPFLPVEIILKKSKKISETKRKQSQQKIITTFNWLSDVKNLYYVWLVNEIHKANIQKRRKQAASTPKRIEMAKKHIVAYNKSERHRKRTAELNHLFPKVHSKESRLKLAKSQSLRWSKKTEKEKKEANLAKSMGRAWNVLKRIDGIIINENIFNSYRSTGSRLANTEPVWKTITDKAGGVEAFLSYVEKQFGKRFVYED